MEGVVDVQKIVESYQRLSAIEEEEEGTALFSDESVLSFLIHVLCQDSSMHNVHMAMLTLLNATMKEKRENIRLLMKRRTELEGAMKRMKKEWTEERDFLDTVNTLEDRMRTWKMKMDEGMDETATRRRRFIGGGGGGRSARNVTLQLDHMHDNERASVEAILLAMKGVISIYFDVLSARCVVRAKSHLTPEAIGIAVLQTKLTSVALISKHDDGTEEETALTEEMATDERGRLTTALPEYLPEDAGKWPPSPRTAAQAIVHIDSQHRSSQNSGGWFGHVASFIAHTLW